MIPLQAIPDRWRTLIALLGEHPLESHETHLSVVYLTARYAVKFKKAVNFGFVDYRTSQARAQCACDELRLNRRFSSGIYLGLIAERPDGAAVMLEEVPASFDCAHVGETAVVMLRIPDSAFLPHLLESKQFSEHSHLIPLIEFLSRTFLAHRLNVSDPASFVATWLRFAQDNFLPLQTSQALTRLSPIQVAGLAHARKTLDALSENKSFLDLLRARAQQGRALDGHGDLRLEHIVFLNNEPHLIDCVEFSAELRKGDIATELGFLVLELFYERRADLANRIVRELATKLGDGELPALLPPFVAYRAMVRCKVHLLRALQLVGNSDDASKEIARVGRYLGIANRMSFAPGRCALIVMCGTTGSGKSACARAMGALCDLTVLRSDAIRLELFPHAEGAHAAYGAGMYDEESVKRTYQEMHARAAVLLSQGNQVILDAAYPSRALRKQAIELARRYQVTASLVHLNPDPVLQEERLEARVRAGTDISHGRPEILKAQRAHFEEPSDNEAFDSVVLLAGQDEPATEAWTALRHIFGIWDLSQL